MQHSIRGSPYVKNYEFTYNFRPWGDCTVVMTCVTGHLKGLDFEPRYKSWKSCAPGQLFDIDTVKTVAHVCLYGIS